MSEILAQKDFSMADLKESLGRNIAKINSQIISVGLGKELDWLTNHRKTPIGRSTKDGVTADQFSKKVNKFDETMREVDPSFSLTAYWHALDVIEQK